MQTQIQMRMRRTKTAAAALARINARLEQDGAMIVRQTVSPNGKGIRMTIEGDSHVRDLLAIFELFDYELIDASGRSDDASFFTLDARAGRAE